MLNIISMYASPWIVTAYLADMYVNGFWLSSFAGALVWVAVFFASRQCHSRATS